MSTPELTISYDNGVRPPRPARPRVAIPVVNYPSNYPSNFSSTPSLQVPMSAPMTARPRTPGTAYPVVFPFPNVAYQNKASEFMFKRFEGLKDFTKNTAKSGLSFGEKFAFWSYGKLRAWSKNWFTHIFLFLVVFLYTILGAMVFVAIERPMEVKQIDEIRKNRYDLLNALLKIVKDDVIVIDDNLMIGRGVNKMLADYEPTVIDNHLKYGTPGPDGVSQERWGFWNAVFYCGTIYTTIGYGHISPSTTTGRAITIIYAIFGIPMFLILLADFGKLFTRGIKFLWAFVRRVYYTGSCRKVRRTGPVQDVIKGVQLVYNFATNRRPSEMEAGEAGVHLETQRPMTGSPDMLTVPQASPGMQPHEMVVPLDGSVPGTPIPENFEVDDEFNLPISVAIVVLLIYIFVGATMYYIWENWGFFESFYFVFISMSTIGFGDFVPQHPMYMMASIVYLIFGLALTSMCINVVQEKLSASFQQASAKIGATIGLHMAEEEAAMEPVEPPEVEVPEVEPEKKKSPT